MERLLTDIIVRSCFKQQASTFLRLHIRRSILHSTSPPHSFHLLLCHRDWYTRNWIRFSRKWETKASISLLLRHSPHRSAIRLASFCGDLRLFFASINTDFCQMEGSLGSLSLRWVVSAEAKKKLSKSDPSCANRLGSHTFPPIVFISFPIPHRNPSTTKLYVVHKEARILINFTLDRRARLRLSSFEHLTVQRRLLISSPTYRFDRKLW